MKSRQISMKPILFKAEMVQAILDGRKSVTRRVVKPQPKGGLTLCYDGWSFREIEPISVGVRTYVVYRPPYRPGSILYVREAWAEGEYGYSYMADDYPDNEGFGWRPSIHMPKEAARIFLRVTDVRVERLQDITDEQAEAEGCTAHGGNFAIDEFEAVWDSTIKKADRPLYGWDANPWVWVIEFERISKEEALKSES